MQPSVFSIFRLTHRILKESEGYNDGLVSVASSRWGGEQGYKGTLVGVSHLDLINWSNRLKWLAGEITGNRRRYAYLFFYWTLRLTDTGSMPLHSIWTLQVRMPMPGTIYSVYRRLIVAVDMLAKEGL